MVEPYLTGVECFSSIQLGRSLFNWDLTPLLLKQGPLFICPGPIRQLNFLRASRFTLLPLSRGCLPGVGDRPTILIEHVYFPALYFIGKPEELIDK